MHEETSGGGAAREFPETAWSRILSARESVDSRRELLGELLETYWKPLYFHARRRGLSVEAAKDAVQGFCVQLLERDDFLARLDPAKGRLRSFLRTSLDHHVANLRHDEAALKRGGGRRRVALDVEQAESELAAAPESPDAAFEREWARSLMERAMGKLAREFEEGSWSGPIDVVLRFLRPGEPPSYAAAAAASGKTVSRFKVFLHRARARFRRILREEVARTVADEGEIDAELAELRRVLSAGPYDDARSEPAVVGGAIELLDEEGRDGLGLVYRARHLRLERIVAARLLGRPPGSERGLADAVRALAKLRHPRVIQVYDLVEEGDEAYLVTEHVPGPQLSRAMPLPVGQALAAALDVCDALAFAHGRGIVHGALTAEEIWFDQTSRAKVVGLGLAPAGAADPRMDVHALGVILHQAVGGGASAANDFLPPPRETSAEVLRAELVAAREALARGRS